MRTLLLALALCACCALPLAAEPGEWIPIWVDPPGLIAPLDVQVIPGQGGDPTLIALLDPASNSGKVRTFNLDGLPVGRAYLTNGPTAWDSQLPPLRAWEEVQLPFAPYRGGAIEVVFREGVIHQFLRTQSNQETYSQARQLVPALGDQSAEARNPGELSALPFAPAVWGVDPRDGALWAAAPGVLWQGGKDWTRLAVPVPSDPAALEVGADGAVALVATNGPTPFHLRVTGFTPSGGDLGTIDIATHVAASGQVLDLAHVGASRGMVMLAALDAPYPVAVTQFLNDWARGELKNHASVPFLFRFDWTGELAALSPLFELPEQPTALRVSADDQTTVLLAATETSASLRILATGDFSDVGDIAIPLQPPLLERPRALAVNAHETVAVLDQRAWLKVRQPSLVLLQRAPGGEVEEVTELLPLLAEAHFEASAMDYDTDNRLWWGGQIVDEQSVRGSVWQRVGASEVVSDTNLFRLLPTSLFSLGGLDPLTRLPYILAQCALPDGALLALAGTHDPPEAQLLRIAAGDLRAPEVIPLPAHFDPLDFGQVTLVATPEGDVLLAARDTPGGPTRVWQRRALGDHWEDLERFGALGLWPLFGHPKYGAVWLSPDFGLIHAGGSETVRALSANPASQVQSLTDAAGGRSAAYLLHGMLGQVWRVPYDTFADLEPHARREVNEALLALHEALRGYYAHNAEWPPAIDRFHLEVELPAHDWERLMGHFIGGRPLYYKTSGAAYDLIVWGTHDEQELYWISDQGIELWDPERGFTPARQRSILPE